MEGVPFVGNDACAHNLLLKGRPLIMRLRQLSSDYRCDHRHLPTNRDWEATHLNMNLASQMSRCKQSSEPEHGTHHDLALRNKPGTQAHDTTATANEGRDLRLYHEW
jgi:hypothetical protein